jgi:predicted nucleic acid-binding Zn ribbon protein
MISSGIGGCMPLYRCECLSGTCGYIDDYLVRLDEMPSACSECGHEELRRVWHGYSVSVGGSGPKSGVVEHDMGPATVFSPTITDDGSIEYVPDTRVESLRLQFPVGKKKGN